MSEITYAQAVNDAISEEMRKDETVFMLGEDIGLYCGAFGVSKGMICKRRGGGRFPGCCICKRQSGGRLCEYFIFRK